MAFLMFFYLINNVIVITALIALIVRSMIGGRPSHDFVIIRRGLVIFGASALWANVVGIFSIHSPKRLNLSVLRFFLGTLGYVAAPNLAA
jgi:hypothetical protein